MVAEKHKFSSFAGVGGAAVAAPPTPANILRSAAGAEKAEERLQIDRQTDRQTEATRTIKDHLIDDIMP
jgi:hypothetical protein